MVTLDGNAIGGLLQQVFGTDMTDAEATCAACGAVGPVAETVVYLRGPGTVVRCRNCSGVLMVISQLRGMNCVDLRGLAALDARHGGLGQVAFLFAQAAPHTVGLMRPQRKRQAFTPDPAPCANSLRLRLLCRGLAGR